MSPLTSTTYTRNLKLLNQIEDCHIRQEFRGYTVINPKLVPKKTGRFYTLSIDQFEKRPNMLKEDIEVKISVQSPNRVMKHLGVVEKMEQSMVVILMNTFVPVEKVIKIEFIEERIPFKLEYRALELLDQSIVEDLFFPKSVAQSTSKQFSSFQWLRKGVASNAEQQTAVRNIVDKTSCPAPYILFGPPGTGKTTTLVEAIGQIYKLRPKENVLVAATSNFAANELTHRLLSVVPDESIFRFFARSCERKVNEIDGDVLDVSNLVGGIYEKPFSEDIYLCRVVVCTLTTAGRLVQANIAAEHFSYVIIDECGSAKEVSALVPIIGVGTSGLRVTAMVVLAGDPKQLGPVIHYEFLHQTNHNVSMLERMMDLELYRKSPDTKQYNSLVITQLRDNFRSHNKLLQFANTTFYDGMLRAKAPGDTVNWVLKWDRLPNPGVPLIFHPVVGEMLQNSISYSFYNKQEADQVFSYVKEILELGINGRQIEQSEIGVISPYACQVASLKQLFEKQNWKDIEVGSVEQYQGREKSIIIISTVRSGSNHVGFLANTKRLNVAITRARALMIVIGDPSTLVRNKHWRQFVMYCKQNGTTVRTMGKPAKRRNNKSNNLRKASDPSPSVDGVETAAINNQVWYNTNYADLSTVCSSRHSLSFEPWDFAWIRDYESDSDDDA